MRPFPTDVARSVVLYTQVSYAKMAEPIVSPFGEGTDSCELKEPCRRTADGRPDPPHHTAGKGT